MIKIFYDFSARTNPQSNLLHRRAMLKRMMDVVNLTFKAMNISSCQCARPKHTFTHFTKKSVKQMEFVMGRLRRFILCVRTNRNNFSFNQRGYFIQMKMMEIKMREINFYHKLFFFVRLS